jgi:hypothetical protein
MNRKALEEVIRQVERRIAQGDCPSIPAFRLSTLEEVIFDLAAENKTLREKCAHCSAPAVADITLGDPINYSLCKRCADLEDHVHDDCDLTAFLNKSGGEFGSPPDATGES